MPRLWNETIEAHRHAVRDATLDATAALVAEQGLLAVTMSAVAQRTGIGRATLYKYFPDVGSVLRAWHERQVADHLAQLVAVRDRTPAPERLATVLEHYALLSRPAHHRPGAELAAALHQGHEGAHDRVEAMVRELVAAGVAAGDLRDDVPPDELARYCLSAVRAADRSPSDAAVHRLVTVVLAGLAPVGRISDRR